MNFLLSRSVYVFWTSFVSTFSGKVSLAQLALASGESECAARLLGAAQKRRDSIEMARWFHQEIDYQHGLILLHQQLMDEAITIGRKEGYAMSTVEMIAYALAAAS